jgi:hypothetical protein
MSLRYEHSSVVRNIRALPISNFLAPTKSSQSRGIATYWCGRDFGALHLMAGFIPETSPADAPWGERYFHIHDPDGHELSFARPLAK